MNKLTSNRVAALATFITGLAGAGTALANVWPSSTTNEIALIAGSVAASAGPIAHVIGSWFWDRTPVAQAQAAVKAGVPLYVLPTVPAPDPVLEQAPPTAVEPADFPVDPTYSPAHGLAPTSEPQPEA